ncbi:hypothetical protein ACTHGU_19335 [Chitinophagaceae bacterium MMS25-I14]
MPLISNQTNIRVLTLAVVSFLLSCSCNEKQESGTTNVGNNNGTYFPVKQFILYEWNKYQGLPITFTRTATLNGQRDSSLVGAFSIDWGSIFRIFSETDIGDPKFLGQYDCSDFQDSASGMRILYYKAKSPKLFTQTLQLNLDIEGHVKTLYIEAGQHSFWNSKTEKLYYSEAKILQIQQHENPLIGSRKDMMVVYRF